MNIWDEKEINVKPWQWPVARWPVPGPAGNHLVVHVPSGSFPAFCRPVAAPEPPAQPRSLPPSLLEFPAARGSLSVFLHPSNAPQLTPVA